ncbi:MAG: hypothetical protein ACJ74J_23425 [Blastocatellia bacterium]
MANRKVIFITELKEGLEAQLLEEMKNSFPSDALARIDGIKEVTICQGHNMFAAVFEYDGEFGDIFSNYVANPAVRAFHARIAPFLKQAPTANVPADLPLVGDVLVWDGGKVMEAVG